MLPTEELPTEAQYRTGRKRVALVAGGAVLAGAATASILAWTNSSGDHQPNTVPGMFLENCHQVGVTTTANGQAQRLMVKEHSTQTITVHAPTTFGVALNGRCAGVVDTVDVRNRHFATPDDAPPQVGDHVWRLAPGHTYFIDVEMLACPSNLKDGQTCLPLGDLLGTIRIATTP